MDYTVIPYNAVNRKAYASLLKECPAATPFHSLEWMRIYELFSHKAHQFLLCAQEGDTLFAAMPVTVIEKFCARAVFSSGFGVHGGPICRLDCGPTFLAALLKFFADHFQTSRTVLVSVQDFLGFGAPLEKMGFKSTLVSTRVTSIPDSYEKLEQIAKSTARYRVRRSVKSGIGVFRSKDFADFDRWQRLCSVNYIARGRLPYPPALYRAAAKLIQETDTLRFYVAKLDGRVVGGSVLVFALRKVYYWMSATDPDFRNFGVNDAIFQAVFRDAFMEGVTSFDFGPSPAGADGLNRFKEKWGGLQKDYYQYSYTSALGRIGANLVRQGKFPWAQTKSATPGEIGT